ncbi:MAG: metalloregulator ArsR/SmtB family transcription factor [Saprospiraceae bacterium]
MGTTKTEIFSTSDNKIAILAKALGHPARIAILKILIKKESCICGAIVDELPLAQSTISQHLKELKKAGIIQGAVEGPSICYCINSKIWNSAAATFLEFFELAKKNTKNCC